MSRQSCVNVSSFPFLDHGYGNFDSTVAVFCTAFCVCKCEQMKSVVCAIGDIEICNTKKGEESILILLIDICFDAGRMFSHDGRTERWGTDGSNCLINLELLNISGHGVGETKYALCLGSELPAAVCGEPSRTYIKGTYRWHYLIKKA